MICNNKIILSGAKNLSLPILASTILSRNTYFFNNLSINEDVATQLNVLSQFNAKYSIKNDSIIIDTRKLQIPSSLNFNRNTRATYYFIGSSYLYNTNLNFSIDNGCNIDDRNINFHLEILNKFNKPYNYSIEQKQLFLDIQPNHIYDQKQKIKHKLPKPSVGATINAILMSAGSNVELTLYNYAKDPYVIEIIRFLSMMGSDITVTPNFIYINSQPLDCDKNINFNIMSDPIEALTYIIFASITLLTQNQNHSNYTIGPIERQHLGKALDLLESIGVVLIPSNQELFFYIKIKKFFHSFIMQTGYFPGIYTDAQPMFALLATFINGNSYISELIYTKRFNYIKEYIKYHINIKQVSQKTIRIIGNKNLKHNFTQEASKNYDLRSDMSIMLLEKLSNDINKIDTKYIDRGYSNYISKINHIINNIEIHTNYLSKKLSNIKIGGNIKYYTEAASIKEIIFAIDFANKKQIPCRVIGSGYNIYFGEYYNGLIIKNLIKYNKIYRKKNMIYIDIGAGNPLQDLVDIATSNQIDIHELSDIPGTIGGAIYGNAGAYGKDIQKFLHSVLVYNHITAKIEWVKANHLGLTYRGSDMKNGQLRYSIFLAKFQFFPTQLSVSEIGQKNTIISNQRRLKFNYALNLGCIYKNTNFNQSTGQLLDTLGIKNSYVYNMYISPNHANIWLNTNNASPSDLDNCIRYISKKIKDKYGIELTLEIEKI